MEKFEKINPAALNSIFRTYVDTSQQVSLRAVGNSMNPEIKCGDVINLVKYDKEPPMVGDIMVFIYKNNELIVHRLLRKAERYFCKGDNSLRIEDILPNQIIGRVSAINGYSLNTWPKWKCELSFRIGKLFAKCGYDIKKVQSQCLYLFYNDLLFNNDIRYIKSNKSILDKSLSFDSKGYCDLKPHILNILQTPKSISEIITESNTCYRDSICKVLMYGIIVGEIEVYHEPKTCM